MRILEKNMSIRYDSLLRPFSLPAVEDNWYLHIRTPIREQGWMAHLSIVVSKFADLIQCVLPDLAAWEVPFRVVKDSAIHRAVNDGDHGAQQVGKVMTIFFEDETSMLSQVERLVELTKDLHGPRVVTDFRVGSIVYVRYGTFHANVRKDRYGNLDPYIMDRNGRWVKETYPNPPVIPPGIINPFESLMRQALPSVVPNPVLGKYRLGEPVLVEPGRTLYAGYVSSGEVQVGACWIKRVKKWMMEDEQGEDLVDRLRRQFEFGQYLDYLRVLDYHEEGEQAFLIFERTEGTALPEVVAQIMGKTTWKALPEAKKQEVIGFGTQIREFLSDLEKRGYYWKSPQPRDFWVTPEGNIRLRDWEFLREEGSHQDALDSLFTELITGYTRDRDNDLLFFTDNLTTHEILSGRQARTPARYSEAALEDLIRGGIRALASEPLSLPGHPWHSPIQGSPDPGIYPLKDKHTFPTLYRGVGGVLYVLCTAKELGYDLATLTQQIQLAWNEILRAVDEDLDQMAPGLYFGAAGLALAYARIAQTGLLPEANLTRDDLKTCLTKDHINTEILYGVSGTGLAVMGLEDLLGEDFVKTFLDETAWRLMRLQGGDGSWKAPTNPGEPDEVRYGFGYGMAGMIYFLLLYSHIYRQPDAGRIANQGMDHLTEVLADSGSSGQWPRSSRSPKQTIQWCKGSPGIALTYLKSFELTGNEEHLRIAERVLRTLPFQIHDVNLSQCDGLSGLGEVYLEAFRVSRSQEWLDRAGWIAQTIAALGIRNGSHTYWRTVPGVLPTADLMRGHAGILHFLMRRAHPDRVFFPCLSREKHLNEVHSLPS